MTARQAYSLEEFSDLMNQRLQALEGKPEACTHYGGLLAVLRQQVDAYRSKRKAGNAK